jgi:hypothetical protein
MERDLGNALERIEKSLTNIVELLGAKQDSCICRVVDDGDCSVHGSEPIHEENSPFCGNPECLHNCEKCVEHIDNSSPEIFFGGPEINPIIDLCEQFVDHVGASRNWSLSNIHGHVISRESIREEMDEFAKEAKLLSDPMGSNKDKLIDFLIWYKKEMTTTDITLRTNEFTVQEYWKSFQ